MSITFRLIVIALLEPIYALVTRAWMPFHFQGIELELMISVCRALIAGLVWLWFGDFILSGSGKVRPHQRPVLIAAAAALLLEAAVCGNTGLSGPSLQITLAVTSLVVALHEELVYRALLQDLLRRRIGLMPALLLSNLCFTLYHFGAQPLNPLNFVYLFLSGCTLGLIYERTRSLVAVITIHSLADAIFCFTPLVETPWPPLMGDFMVAVAFLLALSLYPNRSAASASKMAQFVRVADDV